MKPPIFVCDEGDVLAFLSVKAAECFLEGPDVENLKAYDSEGRLLAVSTVGYQVKVSEAEDAPFCEEELKAALKSFLGSLTLLVSVPQSDNLASLVELMREYAVIK